MSEINMATTTSASDAAAAASSSSKIESKSNILYVGNLEKRVSEYHLMQLFSQFGDLIRVQFMWHHHGELRGQPRGFAFVELKTKADAVAACAQANGAMLAGRPLVVRFSEAKGEAKDAVAVDFKSAGERRRGEVQARVTGYQGGDDRGGGGGDRGGRGGSRGGARGGRGRGGSRGGGGGRGGRDEDFSYDKYAYVASSIPSYGFARDVDTSSRATTRSGVLKSALAKVEAIEEKLRQIADEQAGLRKRARGDGDKMNVNGNVRYQPTTTRQNDGEDRIKRARLAHHSSAAALSSSSSSSSAPSSSSSSSSSSTDVADRPQFDQAVNASRSNHIHPDRQQQQ